MSLRVTRQGDGALPPLVLIHGWGFTAAAWDGWRPELATAYCLYDVALPGFAAEQPAAADQAALDDLDALADQLAAAIPLPALWLGWSLGGTLAAAVAARHPAKVAGLLTLACNPCFVARPDWPGLAPAAFDAFYRGIDSDAPQTLGRFLLLQGQGDGAAKAVVRGLKPALATEAAPSALLAGLDRLAQDQRDYFAALSIPRRYLFGDGDALVPVTIAATPLLADHAQVIAGAGHALLISARAAVLAALRQLQADAQAMARAEVPAGGPR